MKAKKLTRSNKNKMLCGVCGGIAQYFGIDATIVRLIFVIFGFFKGSGLLIYLIAAVVMPVDLSTYENEDEDLSHLKSANADSESDTKFQENDTDSSVHSDKEFDSFFKKDSK